MIDRIKYSLSILYITIVMPAIALYLLPLIQGSIVNRAYFKVMTLNTNNIINIIVFVILVSMLIFLLSKQGDKLKDKHKYYLIGMLVSVAIVILYTRNNLFSLTLVIITVGSILIYTMINVYLLLKSKNSNRVNNL